MKKILLLTFLLLSFEIFGFNTIIFGGTSINREVDMDISINGTLVHEETVDMVDSYDVGIESFFSPFEILHFGLGVRYEPELHEEDDDGIANIVPIYFIGKLLIPIGGTRLTAQVNGGYSLTLPLDIAESKGFTNITGGIYYGVGVGFEMGPFVLGANYGVSTLTADFMGFANLASTADKINITLGYKFGD